MSFRYQILFVPPFQNISEYYIAQICRFCNENNQNHSIQVQSIKHILIWDSDVHVIEKIVYQSVLKISFPPYLSAIMSLKGRPIYTSRQDTFIDFNAVFPQYN